MTALKYIDQNCDVPNSHKSSSECITISVGGCGCNVGSKIWNNYIHEPTTPQKWKKRGPTKIDITESIYNTPNYHKSFFYENENNQHIARNLSIDLDPNTINNIKQSPNNYLFDNECLIHSNQDQDASNIFTRGYSSMGLSIYDQIENKLRKLVEKCDNLSGFMINHSISGGTGSGLTSLLLENLSTQYIKKCKYTNSVMPVQVNRYNFPTSSVDPYNSILSMNTLINESSITSIFDNEQLLRICWRSCGYKNPSYDDMNEIIGQSISCSTCSLRSENNTQTNLHSFEQTLVTFPRAHFIINSLAPVWPKKLSKRYYCAGGSAPRYDFQGFIESVTESPSFCVKCDAFDREEDIYISLRMTFRGDATMKQVNGLWNWLKTNKRITMADWISTDNVTLECKRMTPNYNYEEYDNYYRYRHFHCRKRDIFMMGNNIAITRVFDERIVNKYDLLYSQKSYLHWYTKEGMEEGEFIEARENLYYLECDYMDLGNPDFLKNDKDTDDDEDY